MKTTIEKPRQSGKGLAVIDVEKGKSFALVFCLAALSALCLFGTVGCSHTPTQADYLKVYNDKSLTPEQRDEKIAAMTPDPMVQSYEQSGGFLAFGVVLLVVGLAAKKKSDAVALAAAAASGAPAGSPKADQKAKATAGSAYKSSSAPTNKSKQPDKRPTTSNSKTAASTGPPASYLAQAQAQEKPANALPVTQDEIDAIPVDQRGFSYFTSRPLPFSALQEVSVPVGDRVHIVYATKEEADHAAAGNVPRVRAFTVNGKSIPWYEWELYDPYVHYTVLEANGWARMSNNVVACWLRTVNCDPSLRGYYQDEDPAYAEEPIEEFPDASEFLEHLETTDETPIEGEAEHESEVADEPPVELIDEHEPARVEAHSTVEKSEGS